jgi:hypothetical protein
MAASGPADRAPPAVSHLFAASHLFALKGNLRNRWRAAGY